MSWCYHHHKTGSVHMANTVMACSLCFVIILLLLHIDPCFVAADRGKTSSDHQLSSVRFIHGHRRAPPDHYNGGVDGDEAFGADKRRVYTGPNPLHNR